jgi:sporulation protein YunB
VRFKLNKRIIKPKVSSNLYRKRPSRWFLIGLLTVLFISGFYLLDYKIFPALKYLAEAQARQIVTQTVNEAINFQIAPDIIYENIINVSFDKDGKVALMQPNTAAINRLSVRTTLVVQNKIKQLAPQTIRLSLGQIFGLKILTEVGPKLPVRLFLVGSVENKIQDSFDVAGINQIRHRIKVNISTVVKIVLPLVYQQVKVKTSILLTEAIVMGQVPNIYVNSGGLIVPSDLRK